MGIKQVICVRHDLKMRRGKQIAQAAHASMAFITRRLEFHVNRQCLLELTEVEKEWLDTSFAKICVRVNSEEELLEIYQKAKEAQLETHLVTDSGKTEFHGELTNTCVAIGPDLSEKIDLITGSLELL